MVAYSFQKRFVMPIRVGLGEECTGVRPKRQTIRAHGKRRHAMPGHVLQLYTGMRTQHCKLIGVAMCTEVEAVRMEFDHRLKTLAVRLGDCSPLSPAAVAQFALGDGFANVEDMAAFWRNEHPASPEFVGVLIRWRPLTEEERR